MNFGFPRRVAIADDTIANLAIADAFVWTDRIAEFVIVHRTALLALLIHLVLPELRDKFLHRLDHCLALRVRGVEHAAALAKSEHE